MSELIPNFLIAHLHNAVFAGGLGLGLVGAVTATIACLPHRIRSLVVRYGTVSIQVDNQSDLFEHVMAWLNAHPYARNCCRLSARLVDAVDDQETIQFVPSEGWHWLLHARHLIWLERDKTSVQGRSAITGSSNRLDKITLWMLGRNPAPLRNLIERIRSDYGRPDPSHLKVYASSGYDEWFKAARVRKRPLHSIILDQTLVNDIVSDIRHFMSAETWYTERGVPWRRGYLLYGPPGTGKTSLIRALAGTFDRHLAVLNLASDQLDDLKLATLMADAPERSIILLEDIDAAFNGRSKNEAGTRLTFSGLLNALDGVMSQEGRLLFMTTNHIDRLDPALIRPGRIDRKYELGLAKAEQIQRHYKLYFPNASTEEARRFLDKFHGAAPSPAMVQELLLNDVDREQA